MSAGISEIREKLKWHEARERLLNKIHPELNSVIDIDKFLDATVQELGKMMAVDKCDFIVMHDEEHLRVEYEYIKDPSIPSTLHLTLSMKENGWEMSQLSTLVIDDTTRDEFDEKLREVLQRSGTLSVLSIPVMFREELLGILVFHYCSRFHSWSEHEIKFLSSLAQQTSMALQYTRLYSRMEKGAEITQTLLEITNEINSKADFTDVTSFVLKKAVELLGASYGTIGILDADEKTLKTAGAYPEDLLSRRDINTTPSLDKASLKTLLDKKVVCIDSGEQNSTDTAVPGFFSDGKGSAILSPIILDGAAYGTLNLVWEHDRGTFKAHEIELLTGITNQLALVLEKNRLYSELISLKSELNEEGEGEMKMVGISKEFEKCVELAHSVINSNATILLQGETGTGKELIADFLHRNGDRRDKPYIKINCGAIPETLIESDLFGYEKGAFTGAESRNIGKFELASGGTIFLDEIGELSLNAQVKMLRVLQNGELYRIGGSHPVNVDLRVIAATNIDLEESVKNNRFRSDLFYRLNVFPIHIPPLRERAEDIPLLVMHFLDTSKKKLKKLIIGISDEAMGLLKSYTWAGNIRELENVIERAVITCTRRVITVDDLPEQIVGHPSAENNKTVTVEIGSSIDEMEKHLIAETLKYTTGDKKRAAGILGITRKTLYRKLKGYELL